VVLPQGTLLHGNISVDKCHIGEKSSTEHFKGLETYIGYGAVFGFGLEPILGTEPPQKLLLTFK